MNEDRSSAAVLTPAVAELVERREALEETIKKWSPYPDRVRIVGVVKTFGPETIEVATAAGIHELAENYPQDLAAKQQQFPQATWHFIGSIQSNKVMLVARHADMIHSVSSAKVLKRLGELDYSRPCLLQLNLSGENTKSGVGIAELESLLETAQLARVRIVGLMTIGVERNIEITESIFSETARLSRVLGLPEISMGMSGDVEAALRQGATIVRVGGSLFGNRQKRVGK